MAYLNNAMTTKTKPEGFKTAAPASEEKVKELLLKLLGMTNKGEIILTKGGAAAIEASLKGLIGKGDHIITTVMEHDCTCAVLDKLAEEGAEISWVGVNAYGALNYDEIEPLIKENTKAIVCIHGCAATGNMNNLDVITTIARRHNLLVISDGCQAIGASEINLENLGVDVYCFSGHKKLMGPYGTGGICVKKGLAEKVKAGIGEAAAADADLAEKLAPIDEAKLGQLAHSLEFIFEKGLYGVAMLPHRHAKRFFEAVKSMDDIMVYGNFGTSTRVPIVALAVKGYTAKEVQQKMQKSGIAVECGFHSSHKIHEALGSGEDGLVRFSFGYFNTRMDVNDAVWVLMDLVGVDDLYLLS